jgi:hypothetical protein
MQAMNDTVQTKTRTAYNSGVRFTADEAGKLGGLQSYARANGLKLSDSKIMRFLAVHAEADDELAQTIKSLRPSIGECSVMTSINWTEEGLGAVKAVADNVVRLDPLLGSVAVNEVARALVARTKPNVEFLGIIRASLEAETYEKKNNGKTRASKENEYEVRFTEEEASKLVRLQTYARANWLEVSDSKIIRCLALHAESDDELAETIKTLRPSKGECSVMTSINWTADGLAAAKAAAVNVVRLDPKLGSVAVNEVARALVTRTRPSVMFLGMIRATLEADKHGTKKAGQNKVPTGAKKEQRRA